MSRPLPSPRNEIARREPDRDDLPSNLTPELLADLEDAKDLVRARRAKATIRAYDADLRAFLLHRCTARGRLRA